MSNSNEANVSSLHERVSSLETSQKAILGAVERIEDSLQRKSETPWGVLGTWAGVMMMIVLALGAPLWRDLGRVEMDSKARRASAEDSINGLSTMLQREMKLLDDALISRLSVLEARVTNHQADGHPLRLEQVWEAKEEALSHRVDKLEQP